MSNRLPVVLCIALVVTVTAAAATAAEIHVPSTYPTIQHAVDAAGPNDTVVVAPGWYDGPVYISASRNGLTLTGDGTGRVYVREGVRVFADAVVVRDLEVVYGSIGIYARGVSCTIENVNCWYQDYGIYALQASASLENVLCYRNKKAGLLCYGGSVNMTGGAIRRCSGSGASAPRGVSMFGGSQGAFNGVFLDGNGVGFVASGASVALSQCTISSSDRVGFWVTSGGSAILNECRAIGNGWDGVQVSRGADLSVDGGEFGGNRDNGIWAYINATGSVRDAEFFGNHTGICASGSSLTINGNHFHDNLRGVYARIYPGAYFHGEGLVFNPEWASEDLVAEPTITGNLFENNSWFDILSLDSRPANMLTLDTDNDFTPDGRGVAVYWYGMVRVMRNGAPVEDANVSIQPAYADSWAMHYQTNAEGYAPVHASWHDAQTWLTLIQYRYRPGLERSEANPYTITASADGGGLRGRCTYSWDGTPKSEGFDIDGRYQIAYVELNAQPTADAGEDRTVEANTEGGADVTLDGSGSADEEGDELTYTWMEGDTVLAGPTPDARTEVFLSLGTHTITLLVNDGYGGPASDQCVITVVDTTAPTFLLDVLHGVLWPPNHKMVRAVEIHSLADICDPSPVMNVTVASNEPGDSVGDGSTAPDWEVRRDGSVWQVWLRAERCGPSSGREYTIEAVATDAAGNSSTQSATVTVPHDMKGNGRGRGR